MMRVEIPGLVGTAFSVKFTHVQDEAQDKTPIRHTECKILEKDSEDLSPDAKLGFVSIGYARCHPNDNFSKETGRQMSLKKALDDGDFTKEARTVFWDNYKNWGKERF